MMKAATVASLLASVLYSQQAVATYGWNDAQSFTSPENCNNTCTGEQTGGWNFNDLPTGSFGSFDGHDFSGFNCQDSFNVRHGKRGLIRRTQFTGKAVVGQATKDDASCPKISSQKDGFSMTQFHVSVDKDSELTFEYDMPDGSTCRQKAQCSTEGTTVQNNQCGGAKQVKVKGDCQFGFHQINFDCNPAPPPPPKPSCQPTETLSGGSCVPTPPPPPPSTTSTSTTPPPPPPPPSTTTTTTPVCAATESKNDQGSCVPTTTTTTSITTAPCKDTETSGPNGSCTPTPPPPPPPPTTSTTPCNDNQVPDNGSCIPKTTPPTGPPSTTTPPVTSTVPCKDNEVPDDKGSCTVPPSTTTTVPCKDNEVFENGSCITKTTPPPSTSTTATCKENEETGYNGQCTQKTPPTTPPVSTPPVTTPTPCASTETSIDGKCVSIPVTSGTTTTCKEGEFQNGYCTLRTPTGGSTPPSTSTPAATTSCGEGSSMDKGQCVPQTPTGGSTTTSPPETTSPPSCKDTEEFKDGKCVPKPPTTLTTTTPPSSDTPIPEAPCPNVLPRCLSTWMQKAGSCSGNSDIKCFCPSPDFVKEVQDCVSSWAGDDSEVQAALSFLAGICAEFVPQNPGICTGVPSTITLVPTPSAPPAPSKPVTGGEGQAPPPTPPASFPSTVITFTHTITLGSTITQTVTVPQVIFNTITQHAPDNNGPPGAPATPTQGVGLIPAQPFMTSPGPNAGPSPPSAASTPAPAGSNSPAFTPYSSQGVPPSRTGNSPVATFVGAASNNAAFGIGAALLAVAAFLA